ncbi:unnamed protein product, partial [Prorocentrum cordatum]
PPSAPLDGARRDSRGGQGRGMKKGEGKREREQDELEEEADNRRLRLGGLACPRGPRGRPSRGLGRGEARLGGARGGRGPLARARRLHPRGALEQQLDIISQCRVCGNMSTATSRDERVGVQGSLL